MNLDYAYVLADGLFARKVVKTIENEEFTKEAEGILKEIKKQMENALTSRENRNYENSNQKALQNLRAYGKAMFIVESLNDDDDDDDDDCVINYVKEILKEIKTAETNKEIKIKNLEKTLEYYEKVRYNAITQGSRFNIKPHSEDLWQVVTRS